MKKFVLHRLLNLIPIILGVTFLSFLIISFTPGDFLTTMSMTPGVSPDRIARMRHDFGLDKPWYIQYGYWLYRLSPFQFPLGVKWPDLGYSFTNKTSVLTLMKERFANTLLLSVTAELLIWLIAVPLGVLTAMKRRTWIDRLGSFGVFLGLSIPEILLALFALLFAAETGWFPIGGMHTLHYNELSSLGQWADLLHHLALPACVLAITGAAGIMRYMRGSLLETLHADYVRTARAKGLSEVEVVRKHAFRNAINPLITLMGFSFANLISSSFLVEIIMGWPGLGRLTFDALLAKDLYVIMASLMAATAFLVLGNLFSDLLLAWNDPRIRQQES
jgi:peptide/nickel transport system permease protein